MYAAFRASGRGLCVLRGGPVRWLQTPGMFGVPGLRTPADFVDLAAHAITKCQSIVVS